MENEGGFVLFCFVLLLIYKIALVRKIITAGIIELLRVVYVDSCCGGMFSGTGERKVVYYFFLFIFVQSCNYGY